MPEIGIINTEILSYYRELIMEERDESNLFKCPGCPQFFKSTYDEIGLKMDCPKCGACFKIPDISNAVRFETTHGEQQVKLQDDGANRPEDQTRIPVFEGLSDEERKILNGSTEDLADNLKILTRKNCWEYLVIATLFINQLDNLKQTVLDTSYKQEVQKGWKKNRLIFNEFLKAYAEELFSSFNLLYRLMSIELIYAIESEDLAAIFELGKKFDQLIIKLAKIHVKIYREPMPPEEPYITLHQIITDWVPYCCRALLNFVDNLQKKCVNLRSSNKLCPQISLISPSYFQFVKIMNGLEIGFENAETSFLGPN